MIPSCSIYFRVGVGVRLSRGGLLDGSCFLVDVIIHDKRHTTRWYIRDTLSGFTVCLGQAKALKVNWFLFYFFHWGIVIAGDSFCCTLCDTVCPLQSSLTCFNYGSKLSSLFDSGYLFCSWARSLRNMTVTTTAGALLETLSGNGVEFVPQQSPLTKKLKLSNLI